VAIPQKTAKEAELAKIKNEFQTVSTDLSNIQVEFRLLEEQRGNFEKLEKRQFFDRQDRFRAQQLLEVIQDRSRVLSAKTSISNGNLINHPEALKAEHKILSSPLDIEIAAMDDTDIFRYLWLLENKFPGYIDIQSFSLERLETVNRELLQSITAGETPVIVNAKISANWKTMIPISETSDTSLGTEQAGGVE
jgi:hypothetical protein